MLTLLDNAKKQEFTLTRLNVSKDIGDFLALRGPSGLVTDLHVELCAHFDNVNRTKAESSGAYALGPAGSMMSGKQSLSPHSAAPSSRSSPINAVSVAQAARPSDQPGRIVFREDVAEHFSGFWEKVFNAGESDGTRSTAKVDSIRAEMVAGLIQLIAADDQIVWGEGSYRVSRLSTLRQV